MERYRIGHIGEAGMAKDLNGPWVHYSDFAARIAELEAQLAAAQEREVWK